MTVRTKLLFAVVSALFMVFSSCNNRIKYVDSYIIKKNGKYGLIDSLGNVILQPSYLAVRRISNSGLALVVLDTIISKYIAERAPLPSLPENCDTLKVKYSYVNHEGKFQFPKPFIGCELIEKEKEADGSLNKFCIEHTFSCNLAVITDTLSLHKGYINLSGDTVIPISYVEASCFSENIAPVRTQIEFDSACHSLKEGAGNYGFIDKEGNKVSDFSFFHLTRCHQNRAIATIIHQSELGGNKTIDGGMKDGGKLAKKKQKPDKGAFEWCISTYLVDGKGRIVKQLDVAHNYYDMVDSLAVAEPNELGISFGMGYEFLDYDGSIYKTDGKLSDYEKKSIMDNNPMCKGHMPDSFVKQKVTCFSEGFAGVMIGNNKWVFVDKNMMVWQPEEEPYQNIMPFSHGLAAVKYKGKWGYVDTNFNYFLPPKYDSCGIAGRNLCKVYNSIREPFITSYIDRKGEVVWQNTEYTNSFSSFNKDSKANNNGRWKDIDYKFEPESNTIVWYIVLCITISLLFIGFIYYKLSSKSKAKNDSSIAKKIVDKKVDNTPLEINISESFANDVAKESLQVDDVEVLMAVANNPYRILGVYANSRRQEIVANRSKATAFLNVNRPVEYPLDLKGILPPLSRKLDMMNEAEAHLSIANEQIKYAQFWFLKITPLDDAAFNNLVAGDVAGAMEIWSKQESLSSLQNRLVCYLIESKLELAIKTAEKIYEKFGSDYINKVDANCTLRMSNTELLHQFIDSLGEEIGMQKILGYELGAETKAYVSTQTIGPLINKISSEVDKAKKVDRKDPNMRKETGQKLIVATKEPLRQLKSILPISDPQYVMIADKLGLEILQCGIDYFNNSEDDKAPYTAMKLQEYARSVVEGTLAKQRCEENVKILQKIIDNLPPKEVIKEDKAIKAALSKFVKLPDEICYAVTLVNETKPHLQSIKMKLGSSNAFYLKLSTQVVGNALHNIVEEVNAVQQGNVVELDNGLTIDLDSLMTPDDRRAKYNRIKSTVREAWNATVLLDEFDMESGFKSHYTENRNTLKSMCSQMGISTYVSKTSTTRPISSSASYTTTSNTTTRSRPLTVYSSPPKSSTGPDKNNGCIVALVIMVVIGIIGAFANGGDGFVVGLFLGAFIGGIVYKAMIDL